MGFRFYIAILVLIASVGGCAKWDQPPKKSGLVLPKGRVAADAVGIELGVAQLDSTQTETFEEFWTDLDQQELPLELRKRLDQNGIRAAIMSPSPPAILRALLEPKPIKLDELTELEKQLHEEGLLRKKNRMITHERVSNREGQVRSVTISDHHPEASWIVRNGDKQTVGFGKSVQGLFSVTTYPQGDGSVRLVVQPEIRHGESRHRIGVVEHSFLMSRSQAVTKVDDLKFDVTLRPGETMVLAPTSDIAEMGKLLFGNSVASEAGGAPHNASIANPTTLTHRILMVRVMHTQMDDLFSDSNLVEKLTTTPRL